MLISDMSVTVLYERGEARLFGVSALARQRYEVLCLRAAILRRLS